jgi:hypothetical protein
MSAPFQKGQWVAGNQDFQHPEIGIIQRAYWDDIAREWVMDVALYSPDGERIGRKSPRRGGPSAFEPCIPCESWRLIKRPEFPLALDHSGYRDWKDSLEYVSEPYQNRANVWVIDDIAYSPETGSICHKEQR